MNGLLTSAIIISGLCDPSVSLFLDVFTVEILQSFLLRAFIEPPLPLRVVTKRNEMNTILILPFWSLVFE